MGGAGEILDVVQSRQRLPSTRVKTLPRLGAWVVQGDPQRRAHLREVGRVGARSSVQVIKPAAHYERVIAIAAHKRVIAQAPVDDVVLGITRQVVRMGGAGEILDVVQSRQRLPGTRVKTLPRLGAWEIGRASCRER